MNMQAVRFSDIPFTNKQYPEHAPTVDCLRLFSERERERVREQITTVHCATFFRPTNSATKSDTLDIRNLPPVMPFARDVWRELVWNGITFEITPINILTRHTFVSQLKIYITKQTNKQFPF